MHFAGYHLFCLLAAVVPVLAYPSPDQDVHCNVRREAAAITTSTTSVAGADALRPRPSSSTTKAVTTKTTKTTTPASTTKSSTTSSTKGNLANSIINAICTNPSANFPPAALSVASRFCTEFLNPKAPVTVTATGPGGVTTVTVSSGNTATVQITDTVTLSPSTTVTIPFTITEPGSTETQTARPATVTTVTTRSVTTGVTTTVYTSTTTQTKTEYVTLKKRQNRGILANYADSIVSTACSCLVRPSPVKTVTVTISTRVTLTQTISNAATKTVTNTVVITSELEEFTRSIFTTIHLPGEDDTVTVTPPASTVTSTAVTTVTTTNTVNAVSTASTTIIASPTNSYNLQYRSDTCCYGGPGQSNTYSFTQNPDILSRDCKARCDALAGCKIASLVRFEASPGRFLFQCVLSTRAYSRNDVTDPCNTSDGCQIFVRA